MSGGVYARGNGSSAVPFAHIVDERASGQKGNTSVAGLQQRQLNKIYTDDIGIVLASNKVSIPSGTYYSEALATIYYAGRSQLYIKDVSAGNVVVGVSIYSNNGVSMSSGRFVASTDMTIELQHYVTGNVVAGFGIPIYSGEVEIYASLKLWKVG